MIQERSDASDFFGATADLVHNISRSSSAGQTRQSRPAGYRCCQSRLDAGSTEVAWIMEKLRAKMP